MHTNRQVYRIRHLPHQTLSKLFSFGMTCIFLKNKLHIQHYQIYRTLHYCTTSFLIFYILFVFFYTATTFACLEIQKSTWCLKKEVNLNGSWS